MFAAHFAESRLVGWRWCLTLAPWLISGAVETLLCSLPHSYQPPPGRTPHFLKNGSFGKLIFFSPWLFKRHRWGDKHCLPCPSFLRLASVTKLRCIAPGHLHILRPVPGPKCSLKQPGFSPTLEGLLSLSIRFLSCDLQSFPTNCEAQISLRNNIPP